MTLDEAIKENTAITHSTMLSPGQKEYNAIKLGIEALKQIKEIRTENCSIANLISWPLPGETIE